MRVPDHVHDRFFDPDTKAALTSAGATGFSAYLTGFNSVLTTAIGLLTIVLLTQKILWMHRHRHSKKSPETEEEI